MQRVARAPRPVPQARARSPSVSDPCHTRAREPAAAGSTLRHPIDSAGQDDYPEGRTAIQPKQCVAAAKEVRGVETRAEFA